MFDFPTDLDDLSQVPEHYQHLYQTAEQGFTLAPELASRLDVSGLRSALEKERNAAQSAQKELAGWYQLGPDPDSAKANQSAEYNARIKELETQNRERLITHKVTEAVLKGKGSPDLLLTHMQGSLTAVDDNGETVLRVLASDGSLREKSEGNPMTVDDLVMELRESPVYARAFDPLDQRGSGMDPSGSTDRAGTISGRHQWALNTRIEDIATGKVTVVG